MTIRSVMLSVMLVIVLAVSVLSEDISESDKPLKVFVSIPPLAYLVEQTGGKLANVEILLPSGQSPITYEPTAQEMIRLSEADLLVLVGVPFEQKMLDVFSENFKNLTILNLGEKPDGEQSSGYSHAHGKDPHIWMSPSLAKEAAVKISEALCELKPEKTSYFHEWMTSLGTQLDSVDATIREMLTPYKGRRFFVFHPAFGHFADEYGLIQVAIETDGHEPSPQEMVKLIKQATEDGAKTLFVQPQFTAKEVKTMADEFGARVVQIDPLSEDYIQNLLNTASHIAEALKEAGNK